MSPGLHSRWFSFMVGAELLLVPDDDGVVCEGRGSNSGGSQSFFHGSGGKLVQAVASALFAAPDCQVLPLRLLHIGFFEYL